LHKNPTAKREELSSKKGSVAGGVYCPSAWKRGGGIFRCQTTVLFAGDILHKGEGKASKKEGGKVLRLGERRKKPLNVGGEE